MTNEMRYLQDNKLISKRKKKNRINFLKIFSFIYKFNFMKFLEKFKKLRKLEFDSFLVNLIQLE